MTIVNKKEPFLLLLGDIAILYISLWLALLIRYGEVPTDLTLSLHLRPFSILFGVWLAFFYIAGLYDKHTSILRNKLPIILFNTHLINSLLAVLFFYILPFVDIAPKTNLFVFIVVSLVLFYVWRVLFYSRITSVKKSNALLIGSGDEIRELYGEVNNDKHYALHFVSSINLDRVDEADFEEEIVNKVYAEEVSVIVIDLRNEKIAPVLPKLYNLIFSKVKFIDIYKVYEDVFDRVPLSLVKYNWFIEHISVYYKIFYDAMKRLMDVFIALVVGILSLILYPFVALGIKIQDSGPVFIIQTRIGQNNRPIKIYKFRTMTKSEDGAWVGETENKVTRFGRFLRKSSIDELPQLWSVLKGDLSLIGPRPDMSGLEERLVKEIPYYSIRYLIKPGLSGWAQTHQDIIPQNVEQNKDRLAYDLFYIKNRSLFLDIRIALKTVKTLLTRGGR
jgi:exopolysaccharide biosynthesis polyprenyl glycosylphosphotransferase